MVISPITPCRPNVAPAVKKSVSGVPARGGLLSFSACQTPCVRLLVTVSGDQHRSREHGLKPNPVQHSG
jgi:hypothetical protein